jgi:hypothetical protein
MAFAEMDDRASPADHQAARKLLEGVRMASPIWVTVFFGAAFIANAILAARHLTGNGNPVKAGPGGRPLPKRSRSAMAIAKDRDYQDFSPNVKLLFKWLSVGVLLTLMGDATLNLAHTIFYRAEHWWCGQAVVVSFLYKTFFFLFCFFFKKRERKGDWERGTR